MLTRRAQRADKRFHRRVLRRRALGGTASRSAVLGSRRLRTLSRPADSRLVWIGLTAGLATLFGRHGRRAALRGTLAAALASGLANGPLKWLVRRPRPSRRARRLPWMPAPETTSFPSGHASTAFAFAAGVAQEMPLMAAPVAGLAALVGYKRVDSGVHYPSDVLFGAALGVGVAAATRRLWPIAPDQAAETRPPRRSGETEPSPQGRGLVVVVNRSAGQGGAAATELRSELPEAEVVEVDDGDRLVPELEEGASRALAVGVVGGDGSINAAAAAAAERGLPLLVVPGGALNHFARAVGLESTGDAVEAVRAGRVGAVDRALIDDQTFLNTASIGGYVDLVDAREKLEARIGKWPAVVVALWRVLRSCDPVELEIDGQPMKVWMIFIGNCRYDPPGFAPSWRERLDDGELDIRIVHGTTPWARTRLLLSVLTGRLASCRSYEQRFATEISVRSRQGKMRLARDGETFDGSEEFTVTKASEPLLVYSGRD